MKPFDEEDIVAYQLGELSPRRARALEQALQLNAGLAAEFQVYASMLRTFKDHAPLEVSEEVVERHWQRIRYQMPRHAPRPLITPRRIVAATATAMALTAVVVYVHSPRTATLPAAPAAQGALPAQLLKPEINPKSLPATDQVPNAPDTSPPAQKASHLKRVLPPMLIAEVTKERPSHAPAVAAQVGLYRSFDAAMFNGSPYPSMLQPWLPHVGESNSIPVASKTEVARLGSARGHGLNTHHEHSADVTVSMGGVLIPSQTASGSKSEVVGATHAVSAVGSFHQQLRPAVGYRVTFSYSRPDFDFENSSYGGASINGRIFEVAGTYVVQGPRHGFVSTAVEAGAGLMTIVPTIRSTSTGTNRRVAAIAGTTAEITLSRHIAAQAGYRLQIFRAPDFDVHGTQFPLPTPVVSSTLVSNEPTLGITYRFLRK